MGSEGVLHLSKTSWPTLKRLSVADNFLTTKSVLWAIKANWPGNLLVDLSKV